ncbi:MAG: hypothetical protein KBT68_06940 [bacterium]|nr:hypothetical protein [Candidatus Colisoma equi]
MAKANARFATVKGQSETFGTAPFYVGIIQCERVASSRETLAILSERTGFEVAKIRSLFLALAKIIRAYAGKGVFVTLDGVSAFRILCKGGFQNVTGPWVKGVNVLQIASCELNPFKSVLADLTPSNVTEGLKPVINTVMDLVTKEYDVITGTNEFSVDGYNLALDEAREDEFVGIRAADGTLTKAATTYSDLGQTKAKFMEAPEAGAYTLVVATRCGLGAEFGVVTVERKVSVK